MREKQDDQDAARDTDPGENPEGPGGDPETPGRLIPLAARCPRCGARPAMRATEALAAATRAEPGQTRLGTYQCQQRGCRQIYDLFASALRDNR
jgi:hypothetical protein